MILTTSRNSANFKENIIKNTSLTLRAYQFETINSCIVYMILSSSDILVHDHFIKYKNEYTYLMTKTSKKRNLLSPGEQSSPTKASAPPRKSNTNRSSLKFIKAAKEQQI